MVFLFQLTPHANIRYREAQMKLGQAELCCLLKSLGLTCEITPYTMGGVSFLRFEADALTEAQLSALSMHSAALMIAGDFKELVYSIRQDVTYKILTEATIVDPTTKEVIYSLAQQDMVALRAVMRLGWEIPNPTSAYRAKLQSTCPFAVYAPGAGGATGETGNG